ncbi:methyltransferase domain-containing protein [Candidatus Nitrospira salsa]
MNIVTKMKQDWDRRAKHHTRYWIATEDYKNEEVFADSGRRTADAILAAFGPFYRETWTGLDIGCGIGRVLKPLALHFRQLFGVDVSAEMINKSKTWLRETPNVTTFETSGVDLNLFPNRHFDFVYSYVAFQHMPRPVFDRYLEEINRVLKHQGLLVFQIPIGIQPDVPMEDTIAVRFYEYHELQKKLIQRGFQLLETDEKRPVSLQACAQSRHAFHGFFLAQKIATICPEIHVGWLQAECQEHASFLDTHLYLSFAESCLKQGDPDEAIQTYEKLLTHNPDSLEAWLNLTTILIDNGKIDQAVSTLTNLTHAHPAYLDGHRTLKNLRRRQQWQKHMRPTG